MLTFTTHAVNILNNTKLKFSTEKFLMVKKLISEMARKNSIITFFPLYMPKIKNYKLSNPSTHKFSNGKKPRLT